MRGHYFLKTVLVALVSIVGLSACRVDTNIDTVVNADGSGTVTITIGADAGVVTAEPKLAEELNLTDLAAAGWSIDGPTKTVDGGLTLVLQHPFENLAQGNEVLASLSGPDGPIFDPLIAARGAKGEVHWSFVGSLDFSKGLTAIADQALITSVGRTPWLAEIESRQLTPTDTASLTFKITLPGVPASTAGVSGAGATNPSQQWTVRPGDGAIDLDVENVQVNKAVVSARRIESKLKVVLIVYLLIAVGLLALWIYARSRRNQPGNNQSAMTMGELLELQPDERRVMRYLLRFDHAPNASELAKAVGIPVKELKDHVRSLMRAGLVKVDEGRVYSLLGKAKGRKTNEDRWSKLGY